MTSDKTDLEQLSFSEITDWYIHIDHPDDSIIYPLGKRITGIQRLEAYAHRIVAASEKHTQHDDFSVRIDKTPLRISRFKDVDSIVLSVRRGEQEVPNLNSLSLPRYVIKIIEDNRFLKTGLIILSGAHGGGKSTTSAAIVKRRLECAGGIARTIEDPIEFPLSGAQGKGFCFQTEITGMKEYDEEMAEEVRKAMRGYPTGNHGILMFGEVRDSFTAAEALRASLAGRLVICTIHANTIEDVLFRVVSRAESATMNKSEVFDILKSSLRLIINQEITHGKLHVTTMYRTRKLASILHSGRLDGIVDEVNRQNINNNHNRDPELSYA